MNHLNETQWEKTEINVNLFKEHLLQQFMLCVIFQIYIYEREKVKIHLPFKDYLDHKHIYF